MKLFSYVLKEYLKYVLACISLFLFLFVLFDFLYKSTSYFGKYNPSLSLITKVYIYQMPLQILQSLPIASLVASVAVMLVLSKWNEITVMRAVGMGALRISYPILFGGFLLFLLSFVLNEWIVPFSSKKMHYISSVLIEKDKMVEIDKNIHWLRNRKEVLHFKNFLKEKKTLLNLELMEVSEDFVVQKTIRADLAQYNEKTQLWNLEKVTIVTFGQDHLISNVETVHNLARTLPIDVKILNKELRTPDEMSLFELRDLITIGKESGTDILNYEVAWHSKIAYPFACFFISLLAIPFGYRHERSTSQFKSVMIALGFGIVYWIVLSSARALSFAGDLSPFIGAWLANLLLLGFISYQLWGVGKTT